MINFTKYRCRNCLHWHNGLGIKSRNECCFAVGVYFNGTNTLEKCNCTNWESSDNLVYLENKYLDKNP